MKNFLCSILSLVMCVTLCIPAFAAPPDDDSLSSDFTEEANNMYPDLSGMSIEELNALIHNIAMEYENNGDVATYINGLGTAWSAAAGIAELAGYPCAATIVRSSVRGRDYIESNGLLANTIKTTNAFAAWSRNPSTTIEFKKSDNSDLFYSIHFAEINVTGSPSAARARITDRFDFEFETDMQDLFSTLVNDWAWLSQHLNALTPIDIQIDITL